MTDIIEANHLLRFKPWIAPNFAPIDGAKRTSIPVTDLNPGTLDALAQQWLNQLYAKCNRKPPNIIPAGDGNA